MIRRPPRAPVSPYTALFRSCAPTRPTSKQRCCLCDDSRLLRETGCIGDPVHDALELVEGRRCAPTRPTSKQRCYLCGARLRPPVTCSIRVPAHDCREHVDGL